VKFLPDPEAYSGVSEGMEAILGYLIPLNLANDAAAQPD